MRLSIPCRLILTYFILLLSTLTYGQNVTELQVFTYAKQVVQGTTFQVSYIAKGGYLKSFTPPEFKTFIQKGSPSQSRGTNIQKVAVNGKMSTVKTITQTLTYDLEATKPGVYELTPASGVINGKTYTSPSITIEVLKNIGTPKDEGNGTGNAGKKYFVTLEIDSTTAVVGQHVSIAYKLYSSEPDIDYDIANSINLPSIPYIEIGGADPFASFFGSSKPTYLEVIDGYQYYATTIREFSVFPDKTGEFIFPAVDVLIKKPDKVIQRGMFQQIIYKKELAKGKEAKLYVEDFPPGRSTTFSGIVGKDPKMASQISQTTMTTDEGFTLRLQVDSDMAEERMLAPNLDLGENFEVFDPSITSYQTRDPGKWVVTKVFDYTVLPKKAGTFKITPSFEVFNTEKFQYTTLSDTTYTLQIAEGKGAVNRKKVNDTAQLENRELRNWKPYQNLRLSKFVDSPIYWLLLIAPLGGLLLGIILKTRQTEASTEDLIEDKANNAPKIALKHLAKAKSEIESGNFKEAYKEIYGSLLDYISSKSKNPIELSKSSALAIISDSEVSHLHDRTKVILEDCELALYAPYVNDHKAMLSYEEAKEIITIIENETK